MNVRSTPSAKLLSPQELADYLGLPVKTIYMWATDGTGPKRYRVGRHTRYRLSDVEKWLDTQEVD